MRNLLKYISIMCLTAAFLLGACSKNFIDKTPTDSIPLDQALNSVNELKDALNGAYAALRDARVYGADFLASGDVQGDNVFVEIDNNGEYVSQYTYQVTAGDDVPNGMWTYSYVGILRANQIIDADVPGVDAASVKAQALAIRALLYFKLVNIFGTSYTTDSNALGVPLLLHYDPFLLPTRNTVKQVYRQIVQDLQAGIEDAPVYESSVYLSKYSIEALLARVYLYQGNNAAAKALAVDVIDNGGFSLVTPTAFNEFWDNPDIQRDAVEVLFEVNTSETNNNGSAGIGGYYINGFQQLYASSQLYDLYSGTDIRKTLLITGETKSGASPAYLVNKFPNSGNPDPDNLKVIRLAEVYLIAAEASLPGDEADARKYLNELMAQRDPGLVYTSTGQTLFNDIVQERRKELAFEGDRLYDLNRLKLPIDRVENPGSISAGQNNENLNIPFPDSRRIAPIPLAEILINPNIASQQNPGY
jgi:hypothetical protein